MKAISLSTQVVHVKPVRTAIMRTNTQIDVRRALALSGAFSFLCCCARACLLPFLTLYFRRLGLPPAMTGVVMGTKHLITLVWSPAGSLLAKHYDRRRAAIICSLVCSASLALVLLLVPPVDVRTQNAACNASDVGSGGAQSVGGDLPLSSAGPATSWTRVHAAPVPPPGVTDPANSPTDNSSRQSKSQETADGSHGGPGIRGSVVDQVSAPVRSRRSEFKSGSGGERKEEAAEEKFDFLGSLKAMDPQHQLFFLLLIAVSVWECTVAPLDWTADDGLYEYLDYADASDRYSSTRVWALLGAACGVGGAGLLVSQLSCLIASRTPRSAVHFYCYAGAAALALPAAAFLPLYLNKKRDRSSGLLKAVQLVRGSPCALLGAVTTLLVGVAGSAVDDFLLWQMQDHGSSELHMGLSLALGLVSQAAFPLLAGRVSRLLSPGRVLTVGAASLGLQCIYYSFLWGPWAALPAQALSCLSQGALWWAVKVQCEDVSTPGAERSVSRVYRVLSLHLGSGLGSFAGGLVVQRFGLAWLFRGVAVGLVLWCVCLPLLQWKAPRQRRINYSRLLAADTSEASDSESEQDWFDEAMKEDKSNKNKGRRMNQ